jgi:hypothetical protein
MQKHSINLSSWRSISPYLEIAESIPYTDPYAHTLRIKSGASKSQILKLATNWGISHFGYNAPRARKALAAVAEGATKVPLLPLVSSHWFPNAKPGTLHKYVLSIWHPGELLTNKTSGSRITIARQVGPNGKDSSPAFINPSSNYLLRYFSSETAEQVDFSDTLRCPGIPVWTEYTETEADFSAALKQAHGILSSQEELDVIFSLSSKTSGLGVK